jgi:hypothetical protein
MIGPPKNVSRLLASSQSNRTASRIRQGVESHTKPEETYQTSLDSRNAANDPQRNILAKSTHILITKLLENGKFPVGKCESIRGHGNRRSNKMSQLQTCELSVATLYPVFRVNFASFCSNLLAKSRRGCSRLISRNTPKEPLADLFGPAHQ